MVRQITLADLRRLLEGGDPQLIEVLPAGEFEWAHLPGARNLPLRRLTPDQVDHTRPVVAYCNDFL